MEKEVLLASCALQMAVGAQWMSLLFIPGLAKTMANDPGFNSTQIGCLHSMRLLAMFFGLPFFSWLSNVWTRRGVILSGLLLSSVCTMLTPLVRDYRGVMIFNLLSGFFLGGIIPTTRSLVASYYPLEQRGTQYGLIEFSSGIGGFLGAGMTVAFKGHWQQCFISVGLVQLALLVGCYLWIIEFEKDPPFRKQDVHRLFDKTVFTTQLWQGCFGAFPWSSLSFLMFWLERMDMSGNVAVFVFACIGIGTAVGGIVGGILGDHMAKCNPERGRIFVSHASVWFGIICSCLLLQAIPLNKEHWGDFAIMGCIMGLLMSWPASNQNTNLTDTFPAALHTSMFAVTNWTEGLVSSLSSIVFNMFNTYLFKSGDITPHGGDLEWESFAPDKKLFLLKGYADSMTLLCCLFWFVMQFGYLRMYHYYPKESISLNNQSPI